MNKKPLFEGFFVFGDSKASVSLINGSTQANNFNLRFLKCNPKNKVNYDGGPTTDS